MKTQLDIFLDYCKHNRSFRARQAEADLGFGDARKKVSVLKKQDHIFSDEWVETKRGRCKVYHYEGWEAPNG